LLRKAGGNLFSVINQVDEFGDEIETEPIDVTAVVKQNFLEASNVDAASESVRMIETYRAFEINQRVVRIYDDSLGRAVNDIAKV
jgi:flagellar basal-body rod protein FlgG